MTIYTLFDNSSFSFLLLFSEAACEDRPVDDGERFFSQCAPDLEPMKAAIITEMKRYIFTNRVVNARERRTLTYNKRIELNEDFKTLWGKIQKNEIFGGVQNG